MKRIIRLAVLGLVLYAGSAAGQVASTDTMAVGSAQINTRVDSLARQLQQAQDMIERQQALIEAIIQTQTQQTTTGRAAAPQQASNLLNPNLSLITDFRARVGKAFEEELRAFEVREAEIGVQAPIDPYARADAFIAIRPTEEVVELEEIHITFQTLPFGLQNKTGKFRSKFGKFNRTHVPETPFADRPLASEAYFGEEGMAGVGTSFSWLIPNPWVYLNLDAEVTNIYEGAPAFGEVDPAPEELITGGRRRDLGYLARLETFLDLSESTNLSLGGSYATGVYDEAGALRSHLQGIDVTLRWQPPRRAIYRSVLWQTEALLSQREDPAGGTINTGGLFSYVDWQFSRRWRAGARYDYTQSPESSAETLHGILGSLTFTPSEFSLLSVQGRGIREADDSWNWIGLLKVTFNVGPHGAHPF